MLNQGFERCPRQYLREHAVFRSGQPLANSFHILVRQVDATDYVEERLEVLIATHTYVNPLVALVLGWTLAGELLSASFVFGGVVDIAAIALVGRATSREDQALSKVERRAKTRDDERGTE